MFRPFMRHPQGVYINICTKRRLEVDKISQNRTRIFSSLEVGTVDV
jgi:hypothetical protein